MHKPPSPVSPRNVSRVPNQLLACAMAGVLLGQVVTGLARQHDGALTGLVCALVFVLAGGASLLALLQHLHTAQNAGQHPRGQPAPTQAWVLTLGAGVLGSIYAGSLLA